MRDLQFGIWDRYRLSEVEAVAGQASLVYDRHFEQVALAEQLGFDQYYLIEHQSSLLGHVTCPTALLAALSQRTKTIRLGAMIFMLPFHHPLRLAQDIATLDQLSHGRIEFGTGLGVHEHEFIRWNIAFAERQEMAEEALEIILQTWANDEVTYDGKYWSFNEALPAPRPYQQPHPPIWCAVHSNRSIDFAVEHDLDVAQNVDTTDDVEARFAYFRQQWTARHGDTKPLPRTFLMRAVYVGETDAQAEEIARRYVPDLFSMDRARLDATRVGSGTSRFLTGPIDTAENAARRAVFAGIRDYEFAIEKGVAIVGSPETVAAAVAEQVERCQLDVFCAEFNFGDMPPVLSDQSMLRFSKFVVPRLR